MTGTGEATGASWEELFEESIAVSLYLPEPDSRLTADERALDNLPDEQTEVEKEVHRG